MIVMGMGFRAAAERASFESAYERAMGAFGGDEVDVIATVASKMENAVLLAFAQSQSCEVQPVAETALAAVQTPTQSARVAERFGTGSVAEAAALAAAGPGAILLAGRVVSADGMATAAVARSEEAETQ